MDYGELGVFEQLTGGAYFTPASQTSALDLGNVLTHGLDWGLKRRVTFKSRRGKLLPRDDDPYGSEPRFTIEVDEWSTALVPLFHLGDLATPDPDVIQPSAASVSVVVVAVRGRAVSLGAYAIDNVRVIAPAGKIEGLDFSIDRTRGKFYTPLGSTIASGTNVTVLFDQIAVVFNSVKAAGTVLSNRGTFEIFEEDSDLKAPKTVYSCPVALSVDKAPGTKLGTYKSVTLRATVLGPLAVLKLSSETIFDELLLDDGTILLPG